MRRCVLLGGADVSNYERIRTMLREDDFFICCDSGLKHRKALGIEPGLIVGDFDSHENPNLPVETVVLPCEKDDTDSVFAAKAALERGYTEFLLVGMFGGRLDHTLGNLSLLLMLDTHGCHAVGVDDYSEMEIVSDREASVEDRFSFFSLLNISGMARGITIVNAKYPLQNGEITCDYQYGISNEVLPGQTARIRVEEGRLLLMKVY